MNTIKNYLSIFLIAICAMCAFAETPTFGLNSTVTLEQEFRYNADSTHLFYEHTDLQYKYAVNEHVDMFASYRLIFQDAGGWDTQNMFVPGFTLKTLPTKYGTLSLRSKLEFTLSQNQNPNSYKVAEFLKYSLPYSVTKYNITPFVGDEPFFDAAHSMNLVQNRVYAGVDFTLTENVRGVLTYYRQSDKNNGWTSANVVMAQLKYSF